MIDCGSSQTCAPAILFFATCTNCILSFLVQRCMAWGVCVTMCMLLFAESPSVVPCGWLLPLPSRSSSGGAGAEAEAHCGYGGGMVPD